MKIALLTDTHFGARSDAVYFHKHIAKFYDFFFDHLKQQNIKRIVHIGDMYDRRKYINFLSLSHFHEHFIDRLRTDSINLDIIIGNHDTFFKNTNRVNSPKLLLGEFFGINIYESPITMHYDNVTIDYIPWITEENYEETINMVKTSQSTIAFGHLELDGFRMYKGIENKGGMSPKIFDKYEMVYTGHFHTRSSKGNITYLGAPYEITWNDYDDSRGFHIYDTETREVEFIKNPHNLFEKILYDDRKADVKKLSGYDFKKFHEKIVKIIIINKEDFLLFDDFLDKLEAAEPVDVKIEEDLSEFTTSYEDDVDPADTLEVLETYVRGLTIEDEQKEVVKDLLTKVYIEAMNRE